MSEYGQNKQRSQGLDAFQKLESYAQKLEEELKAQKANSAALDAELGGIKSSISYLIGRLLTLPFRFTYNLIFGKGPEAGTRWTIGQMFISSVASPLRLIRKLRFKHIQVLAKAFKEESPAQIAANFRQFISSNSTDSDQQVKDQINQKLHFTQAKENKLEEFLSSGQKIHFPHTETPVVSILLVLYNRAELSLVCLRSIRKTVDFPHELIVIDNASSDASEDLMKQVVGLTYIRNESNRGFVEACNQGAELAKGKHLLLLNNDAQLKEGSLQAALKTLESNPQIGCVGGKIILLDGTLQEAGNIIWEDGSCLGYGRGLDPDTPTCNFRRPVDYCSGVFMLTPSHLFKRLGGFDMAFAPAYYEETDYCMRLWEAGYQVIYEPQAEVIHYEFASSKNPEAAVELQEGNREVFYNKHQKTLQNHHEASVDVLVHARVASSFQQKRILFIEDMVPHQDEGSGFPRSNQLINHMVELGYAVTLLPINFPYRDSWERAYQDIPREVEVLLGYGQGQLSKLIQERKSYYDFLWVSRPHSMALLTEKFSYLSSVWNDTKIIYDSEAIFTDREMYLAKLNQDNKQLQKLQADLEKELALGKQADHVVVVNDLDAKRFDEKTNTEVAILNIVYEVSERQSEFEEQSGLLFVGNMDHDLSPNVESLTWLVKEVYPILKQHMQVPRLDLVGTNKSPIIQKLAKAHHFIHLHGRVEDLSFFLNQARLFVVPTRYAAGSPAKALLAASSHVPIVCTDLIEGQLGWKGTGALRVTGINDAEAFASQIQLLYQDKKKALDQANTALNLVKQQFSKEEQLRILSHILS